MVYAKEEKKDKHGVVNILLSLFGAFSLLNCVLIYFFIEILKNI